MRKHLLAAAALGLIALTPAWTVQAEETRVTFPDLEKLVHYTTVRRGNVTEHIMTTPAAIEAVKNRQPIPDGTHFVLVDRREGQVHRYFVMEKGAGFGAEYDERRRTADWQFQWFWPDKSVNMQENTARCQACHQSRAEDEYIFTFSQLKAFSGRPVE